MNNSSTNSLITYTNLKYYGVDIEKSYYQAGDKISSKLINEFGLDKKYIIIAGLGGNGTDGITTAYYLAKANVKSVEIYLVGRSNQLSELEAKIFDRVNLSFINKEFKNVYIKQDSYSKDIPNGDIIIESLIGSGKDKLKLNKRFQDIINRIVHFKSPIIAIDLKASNYKAHHIYSLIYPKDELSEVINLDLPSSIEHLIGPGEVKYLFTPKKFTYKSKNGELLYISSTSDSKYLEEIILMGKEYEVLINIYNFNQKDTLSLEFKQTNLNYFRILNDNEFKNKKDESNSIVYGYFNEENFLNETLLNELFKTNKIQLLNLNFIKFNSIDLNKRFIFVNDKFKNNKISNNEDKSLKNLLQLKSINIINISLQISLYNSENEFKIQTSNISSKPNYSRILTNLIGILSTNNDTWLSMRAAIFILELSYNIDEDYNNLINNISEAIMWCKQFN